MNPADCNIVLTENISDRAVELLRQSGYSSITKLDHAPTADELKELLATAHLLGIRSRTEITSEVLESAPELLGIGCFCIGTNQVDLAAAAVKGVPVFNAPFSNTRSVAELTISAIIALLRGIPEKNLKAHAGVWQKSAKLSHEARKKKLGIVGYGNIGSQLSVIASALGMHVYYYDITNKLPHGNAREVDSIEELYKTCDVITYHVPATPDTKHMVNREALAMMKPGVHIINYARGSIIDIDALAEALKSGQVAGAAIDVFPEEPADNTKPFMSPLQEFPNVLLTPHIGGSTLEAQENIGLEVAEKFVRLIETGSTETAVEFPQVSLPTRSGACRLINTHKNEAGFLSQVNAILSKQGINVLGQSLQTNESIGYVMIDMESGADPKICATEVAALPGSIATRIITQ